MKSIRFKFKMSSPALYKIINICSLIFAIISIILAYSLYEKRKVLFDNNKSLANAISNAALIMDKDSGTKVAGIVKTSSLNNTESISVTLIQFKKQLNEIINQRNILAKTIETISSSLILPQKFTTVEFEKIASYKKANEVLLKLIKSVNDRNDNLIEFFIKASGDINYAVNKESFILKNKNLVGYEQDLNEFELNINKIKEKYSLTEKELAQAKKEITELQKLNEEHLSKSNRFNLMVKEYDKQLEKLLKENKEYTNSSTVEIKQNDGSEKENKSNAEVIKKVHVNYYPDLYYKLKGKVLKFNKKWGFAIINIGSLNKIKTDIDGEVKTVTVPLPINKQMFVARGNKFIAKVTVSKVYDNYAVVNLGSPTDGTIEPGDIVFFQIPVSTENAEITKAESEESADISAPVSTENAEITKTEFEADVSAPEFSEDLETAKAEDSKK